MKALDLLPVRQLMESKLMEARGLGARRPGEEFVAKDDPNQKIYLDNVSFYPEEGGQFESMEDLQKKLKSVNASLKKANATVTQVGDFKSNMLAFGVATFRTPEGMKLSYIKPFQQVDLDPTRNAWDNQTGIPGYRYNSKSSRKAVSGMSPQDILKKDNTNLTAERVVDQISDYYGRNNPLTLLAANLAHGAKLPLEIPAPADMPFTAFRDYFCEILHPIALQVGSYTGNAADAAKKFLPGGSFDGTTISYGSDKTEGLSDSVLTASDGTIIKVSSKGGAGAAASITSLLKCADELKTSNPKLYKKYRATIDLINRVKAAGQHGSPLMLGVEYGIINEKEAESIRALRGQALVPMAAMESMKLSARLKKMLKEKPPKDISRVSMYYHAIATVAHKVADYINDNTDFGKAASAILNNGALIQVYTKATEKKGRWVLESFTTKWPSDTVTGVKFSADKPYYSTDIKGNFTFKILRNGAQDVDSTKVTVAPAAMTDRSAPKPVSPKKKAAPTPAPTPRKKK